MAFIALLGIFLIQKYATRPSGKPESFSELKISLDPQAVHYIQVYKQDYPDSGLVFARKDTGWIMVNEFNTPAKSDEVKKIFDDVVAVRGSIRSEAEDLYPDFEIDDRRALQIKFLGADQSLLTHVYVGKGTPDGKGCFVRLPGSPNVYKAEKNFISRFAAWAAAPEKKLPTDRWMNLRFCPVKAAEMASFKIQTPKTVYEFAQFTQEPADTAGPPIKAWRQLSPTKGTILEESKIKSLQSSVGNLSAQGVANPDNAGKFGLDNSSYTVSVSDTSGNSGLFSFSEKIDTLEQRYVLVRGNPVVYRVNKNVFERIFVTPFEKPKEPKPAAGT
jgi:hypothetical protein